MPASIRKKLRKKLRLAGGNMGSRNEMRDCTAQLITIGEDIDITSLIVCHTNKRKGAYGRDREYIMGAEQAKSSPMRENCKAFILKTLHEAGGCYAYR